MEQKRILAINDISCFGKCSLAVATPILSVSGAECCLMPTAILSTHTAFKGYTFRDLTEDLIPVAKHWKELGLSFNAIYSGYLGSKEQVCAVEEIIEKFSAEFGLVDPVMGDNGVLYDGFTLEFAIEMKKLIKRADIIVPNVTEASFLTDTPYEKGVHTKEYILSLCEKLKAMCSAKIVITGINLSDEKIGTAVFEDDKLVILEREKFNVSYSGTGDVFASTLASALMQGKDLKTSATIASDFVTDCIVETKRMSGERNYGVNFEPCLEKLIKYLRG